ncbi:MAG: hypothetical protein ACREL7_02895 [Longimicrobiales bacterium]
MLGFWRRNIVDVVRSAGAEWKSELVDSWRSRARVRRGGLRGVVGAGGDVKFAARWLVRRPLLTGSIVVTLALGLGANAAVFALIAGVLLRPIRLPQADRVVSVYQALNERRRSTERVFHDGYSTFWWTWYKEGRVLLFAERASHLRNVVSRQDLWPQNG